MVRILRAASVPLVLAGMLALAGVSLGRIYHGPLLTLLVAGAAVGSVGVSVAARRLPAWLVSPLSVLALSGYALWALDLAADRAGTPGAFTDVASDALRNGIPRLLTAMIPVEPQPDTVIVPVVAAWLAGLASAEVAVRGRRVLLGYAPPVLLYAGALYVVGPNAAAGVAGADPSELSWSTLTFAGLAATGLAVTARTSRSVSAAPSSATLSPTVPASATADTAAPGMALSDMALSGTALSGTSTAASETTAPGPDGGTGKALAMLRLRLAAGSAAALAVVVALTAVIGPAVAARVSVTPVDPRQYIPPPEVDSLDENPLIRISGWALNPDQHLFDVSAPAARQSTRLRLAVLNDYDGVTWHVGATYRSAGRVLPPARSDELAESELAGQAGRDGTASEVRQEITIADLTGRLLPAIATPREVAGIRVAYDQGSGTVMRPEGLTAGLQYTISSIVEGIDPNVLSLADVPSGPAVARVIALGEGVPAEMERLAEQLGQDSGSAYDRVLAIEEFISTHYRLVADAPSGHAYPNLEFFLFGRRNAGGQRGTSEQFAASFAVLGRLMGLPTRVVVGFQLQPEVRGADAFAWPEVLFSGVGWVPFDPLPRPDTEPRQVEEDFRPKPEPSNPPPSEAPAPSPSPIVSASAAAAATLPSSSDSKRSVFTFGLAGAAIILVAGYACAIPLLRRSQRRRRLAAGDPGSLVTGAWLEVTDALRLAGRPAWRHLAASEVVAHAAAAAPPRSPAPPIDRLATAVNQAMFAPGFTDRDLARAAVSEAIAYVEDLRSRRPWWRRLLWSLHPGPLRWHRRR